MDFHPGVYQEQPPNVTGRDVLLVDFSYPRPVLDEMARCATSILILDHHKSAAEDLAEYPEPPQDLPDPHGWLPRAGVYATFDMERSGAGITWDHFFPEDRRPRLIDHIEDRDLWRFKLPHTREIQAALFSYPYDFEVWDGLIMGGDTNLEALRAGGEAIERKHHKDIDELLGVVKRRMTIGGHSIWLANLPYTLTSDACHALCEIMDAGPFGACYWDTPEGRVFSLRSVGDFDVSEIAKAYGGGGHRNAAGFRMALGWEGDT
jgi:hypothetical protein